MSGWVSGWVSEWVGGWVSGWVGGWVGGWLSSFFCWCHRQGMRKWPQEELSNGFLDSKSTKWFIPNTRTWSFPTSRTSKLKPRPRESIFGGGFGESKCFSFSGILVIETPAGLRDPSSCRVLSIPGGVGCCPSTVCGCEGFIGGNGLVE